MQHLTRSANSLNTPYEIIDNLLKIKLCSKKPNIAYDKSSKTFKVVSDKKFNANLKKIDQFKLLTRMINDLLKIEVPLKSLEKVKKDYQTFSLSNSSESLPFITSNEINESQKDSFLDHLEKTDEHNEEKRIKKQSDLILSTAQTVILDIVNEKGPRAYEDFLRKQLALALEYHRDSYFSAKDANSSLLALALSKSYPKVSATPRILDHIAKQNFCEKDPISKLSIEGGLNALVGLWLNKSIENYDFQYQNLEGERSIKKLPNEERSVILMHELYRPKYFARILQECIVKNLLITTTSEQLSADISRVLEYVTATSNNKVLFAYQGSEYNRNKLLKLNVANFESFLKKLFPFVTQSQEKKNEILSNYKKSLKNAANFQDGCCQFLNQLNVTCQEEKKLYNILLMLSQKTYTIPILNILTLLSRKIKPEGHPNLSYSFTENEAILTVKHGISFVANTDVKLFFVNTIRYGLMDPLTLNTNGIDQSTNLTSHIMIKIHPQNEEAEKQLVQPLRYFGFNVININEAI
jgi:hypothetical protein